MQLIYFLDLTGIFVFAISGTLSAGRKSLDIFGVMVIAVVTALGGGTFRDMMLGNTPVLWIRDPTYIAISIVAAVLTIIVARRMKVDGAWLLYADAFGLALFTVLGTQVALQHDVAPTIAIMMGVMSGAFGGLLRDITTNEVPLVLRREIYATAAVLGSVVYLFCEWVEMSMNVSMILAVIVAATLRIYAIRNGLSLPIFRVEK